MKAKLPIENRILNTDFHLPGVDIWKCNETFEANDLVNVLNEFVLNKKRLLEFVGAILLSKT